MRSILPTNAQWPCANDWSYKTRKASPYQAGEEKIAAERQARRIALQQVKKHKHELFDAILNKDLDTTKLLLKQLPSLLERHTPYGATPLIAAASANDPRIVAHLLELGADVLTGDGIGATALIMAASKGGTEVVDLLLNSKQGGKAGRAYLLAQTTRGGETAVMAATKGGHTDTLKALLKAGAPHAGLTRRGASAFLLACKHDRVECAQCLMQAAGARPGDADPQGQTALMYAAAAGATQALHMLLALQPPLDVNQPDMEGLHALDHACQGGHVACAEALLGRGAQLDCSSNSPEAVRLLSLAAKAGHGDMVSWLLSKGLGNQSLLQPGSANPVFAAVRSGSISAVDALLAAGARLEVRDGRGRTPLGVAASHGMTAMVRLLVGRSADLLAADEAGRVPRQIAAHRNHRATAQVLSELAHTKILVPDSALEKEQPEVGAHVAEEVRLWKPHRRHRQDPTRVSTYQLY